MDAPDGLRLAAALMTRFAERTGLAPAGRPSQRYLWTDAFAVCNFLGLARSAAAPRFRDLAVRLVREVHHVLGRHRPDDRRSGWLSGLADEEGEVPSHEGRRDPGPLDDPGVRSSLEALSRYLPLIDAIESCWSDARQRGGAGWLAHFDINEVMLATSLAPGGFLAFG